MEKTLLSRVTEKLDSELKEAKLNRKAKAVSQHVKDALLKFCSQEEEFAQAIIETDKKLGECCESITKDIGDSISDLEVYRKAVQFYFSGADIKFEMRIDLCASVKGETKSLAVSLMDLI